MTHLERSKYQQFPFHMVMPSPWPLMVSLSILSLALSLAFTMHGFINNMNILYLSLFVLTLSSTFWFRDVISEATYLGDHTIAVRKGINLGFLLFVLSEVLIFASLFWAYFHSAMSPDIILGAQWPPVGIEAVQPTELPLLNTIILLSSGATITYSHHALINKDRKNALMGLLITTILIVIFVSCQYIEYINAMFTISDGVYGTVFYAGTGLHFLHMVMLAVMLMINYWRMRNYHLTSGHHVGYETTIIYCHVLDVIWLFLYIIFYWWAV
uniref:Cytochrome c oxidase subunit 3 n=1 Tax=Naumovozyma castellii TaxID=27288 RepID=A0A2H4NZN2_NAUCA|nr:cytochrome c oxidase subunit III [Naumovozyma castellii]AAM34588.1 cytochrome c oxidase subunit III [Naumovozyma castellii]ATV99266.1 cytochrome c oxidase subunit 3 [Naumovozyma castellii]ATV99277.1 cytochrome c oxidase subunit 3 [Naumovozyma castellii]ATV99288.1 cytochrome c oxidase subunit 3 [Naumovozyma castellii]